MNKIMGATNTADVVASGSDIKVSGNPDVWRLLCKASSESQGWAKSTKVLETPLGCIVQVSTQVGGMVAEALTYIPGGTFKSLGGSHD